MTAQPHLDQALAAAMHGNRLRVAADAAGRFLRVVEGPLTAPALAWATMPGAEMSTCSHLPPNAPPQPLIGTLYRPGELLCAPCSIHACQTMPARCAGCGLSLDRDDLVNRDVVVAIDNHVTLIGYACPTCKTLCDYRTKETHQ